MFFKYPSIVKWKVTCWSIKIIHVFYFIHRSTIKGHPPLVYSRVSANKNFTICIQANINAALPDFCSYLCLTQKPLLCPSSFVAINNQRLVVVIIIGASCVVFFAFEYLRCVCLFVLQVVNGGKVAVSLFVSYIYEDIRDMRCDLVWKLLFVEGVNCVHRNMGDNWT